MKVPTITNTSNISIVKRIKNMFHNCGLKLKTLTKDVFERKEKYIIFDGKKMRERDLPNYVTGSSDIDGGIIWGEIKFYPEDEAIMAKIKDIKKRMEYGNKLIDEGKFTKIYYENSSKK